MNQIDDFPPLLGMLVFSGKTASALPLQKTRISGQITGPIVLLNVTQEFTNPYQETVELSYLFPLPHKAAITDFEIRTHKHVIKSEIRERTDAEEVYQSAVQNKKLAAFLEQRRPNLFAVKIGNVQPGEVIETNIRLQERLKLTDGVFELVLPFGLTPRYHTADHPQEKKDTDITLAMPGEKIGSLELDLSIDAGVPVGDPSSPSHDLVVIRFDQRRFQVKLPGEQTPNKDFVLRYPLVSSQPQGWGWLSRRDDHLTMLAVLFPPALPEDFIAPPRDFIFVLDRSGSMSGEPIAQARNALRACLRSLNPEDTFRILLFDDQTEWYKLEPGYASQAEIDQADLFLTQVEGRGGTEILGALEQVLRLPEDEKRIRYVVFLTDGAVSTEERTLAQLRKKIGKSRVFTFGIGPSVNRALLEQMAEAGRGQAEFLQLNEDIEGAVIRFQDRISFPMLTDLSLQAEGAKSWDFYPARLPDLYAGQPIEICGHILPEKPGARILVSGLRAGHMVELSLPITPEAAQDESIEYVWARARVDHLLQQMAGDILESEQVRGQIIGLAIKHKLLTPYTAFVAVGTEAIETQTNKPRLVEISQPLPEGLNRAGFNPLRAVAPSSLLKRIQFTGMAAPSSPDSIRDGRANAASISSDLDMPSFLRRQSRPASENAAQSFKPTDEFTLRSLARSQNMDGSWNRNIEQTAAALLAFICNGHHTQAGDFRTILRRAARWLSEQSCSGLDAFLQALVLHELARVSGVEAYQIRFLELKGQLPKPKNALEKTVFDIVSDVEPQIPLFKKATTLDEIRLAGILAQKVEASPKLLESDTRDLVRIWLLACEQ